MKIALALLIFGIVIISGCNQKVNNKDVNTNYYMKLQFKTSDNINIVGNYYDADSDKNVILLHRLNVDKSSWDDFPLELRKNGFNVLAIDLRGHGQSDLNWNNFGAKEFNDITKDVEAAATFMNSRHEGTFFIIGESVGANTALNYALKNKASKIVLLSPGLDYRGIKTDASSLNTDILFVVSKDDAYSYESVQKLYRQSKGKKELKVYDSAGHGAQMFVEKDLSSFIVDWLNK
ncbi:MAG: alpha/beta fold hydrolase [Nanoarchaeota archaeon]